MIFATLTIAMTTPAAAQDVTYHFDQIGGDVDDRIFTLPAPPPSSGAMIERQIGLLAVEPFEVSPPKVGAPYSADISTDIVQQLADGNRIERHTTSSVARDGQGRTRREQQLTAIGPILPQVKGQIITITDPVGHVSYSLDPDRHVAMRSPLPTMKPLDGQAAASTGTAASGPFTMNGGSSIRTESLGTEQIEGVQARGTRTVVTIEANAIGNQSPIQIVTEQWYSPELGEVVLSRRSDPRFGETTYRLQNVVRAEPPTELFQVPADYTIETLPAFGAGVRIERRLNAR